MADSLSSSEYIGSRLVIFTALFIPLQIITVGLRAYARWLVVGPKFALDDAFIYLSLVFQLLLSSVAIASVSQAGVGHHLKYLHENDPTKLLAWGKYLLAIVVLYAIAVNLPKLAILILYKKLFPMRTVQIAVHIIAAILISGSIAIAITSLAACQPFEANYNPTLPGAKCINREEFFSWASIPNMATDVAMLVLPLPIVWNLHNSKRIKIALTFTFIVGSSGLATSILRFVAFLRTNSFEDGTWDAVELIIWTITEPGIYLISACLLTYRPLLERIGRTRPFANLKNSRNLSRGFKRSGYGSGQGQEDGSGSGAIPLRKMDKNNMGFTQLNDEESSVAVDIVHPNTEDGVGEPHKVIKVTTDIENSWSRS